MLVANIKKYKRLSTKLTMTEIVNSTTNTTLMTYTIPANTLKPGDKIVIKANGTYDLGVSGHYNTVWVNINGSDDIANTTQSDTTTSGRNWSIEIEMICKSSTSMDIKSKMLFWYQTIYEDALQNYYTSVDFTSDFVLAIKGQPSNAHASTGIRVYTGTYDIIKA